MTTETAASRAVFDAEEAADDAQAAARNAQAAAHAAQEALTQIQAIQARLAAAGLLRSAPGPQTHRGVTSTAVVTLPAHIRGTIAAGDVACQTIARDPSAIARAAAADDLRSAWNAITAWIETQ